VQRLKGARCLCLDSQGHGLSDKPAWTRRDGPRPLVRWRDFGEDVAALARELDLHGAVAVGHSMGGHAVTLAAALEPRAFQALVLIDPVIMRSEYYRGGAYRDHYAVKRRDQWSSPDEMRQRFAQRPPFAYWDPDVLQDYCAHALEGNRLACPPRMEAGIYENTNHPDSAIFAEIARVQIPVRLLRASRAWEPGAEDMMLSPTDPDLASRFAHVEDFHLVERSHFIPMEDPAGTAAHIQAVLDGAARRPVTVS
jgi:pimeloyl-ACP methyl ester carboxylesterase